MISLVFARPTFAQEQNQFHYDQKLVIEKIQDLASTFAAGAKEQNHLRSTLVTMAISQPSFDPRLRDQSSSLKENRDISARVQDLAQIFAFSLIYAESKSKEGSPVASQVFTQMALQSMIEAYLTTAKTTGDQRITNAKNRRLLAQCLLGSVTVGCGGYFIELPHLLKEISWALSTVFGAHLILGVPWLRHSPYNKIPRLSLIWPSLMRRALRKDMNKLIHDFWWTVDLTLASSDGDLKFNREKFKGLKNEIWAINVFEEMTHLPIEKFATLTCEMILQSDGQPLISYLTDATTPK